MPLLTTNTKPRIGIIGLGEVGSRLAAGLTRAGCAEVWGYEPHFDIHGPREKERRQIYLDLSSAIPGVKKESAARFRRSGARFLDGGHTPEDFRKVVEYLEKYQNHSLRR